MPRDPKAAELRAVAPIVTLGGTPRFVGSIALISNGQRVIGVTSVELLRLHGGSRLGVAMAHDGSGVTEIANWSLGRYSGLALVELSGPPASDRDVVPLPVGAVHASVDVHGAPAAIAVMRTVDHGFARELVPVHVDRDDGGGMSDHAIYLASPIQPPVDRSLIIEGAPVFAWLPPDPALGRSREVVLFGIARPRAAPVIAELIGLEDVGRALITPTEPAAHDKLPTAVAGEIDDHALDPLAGLDD